jgi:hypothetical protein
VVVGGERRSSRVATREQPEASGTRAMMPTPAAAAAGRTRSSGLSRNAFRMICTEATPGRAIADSAWSHVSTDDAVRRDRAVLDERVERVVTSRRRR